MRKRLGNLICDRIDMRYFLFIEPEKIYRTRWLFNLFSSHYPRSIPNIGDRMRAVYHRIYLSIRNERGE